MTYKYFTMEWTAVILWAGFIFIFSSQPYEKQDISPNIDSIISEKFVEDNLSSIQLQYAKSEVSVQRLGAAKFVEFFIRKTAHFIEFAILAFLIYRALQISVHSLIIVGIISIISSVLYAISDEFHQSFTSNRTPLIHDVFVDSIGVLFGVFIAWLFYRKKRKKLDQ